MHEAKIEQTETGLRPTGDGWFILNVADIGWDAVPGGGTWCVFEAPSAPSTTLGIGVHVLWPGETPGMYHAESDQEGFLVLSGECLAVVEGQERRMGPWDYLHCPPGTAHITIGAGAGPCAILMVGTRSPDHATQYLPDPVAARHGAAVAVATDSPMEAYAGRPPFTPVRSPWPLA
jgi:quercetin dioxygenase-like cupin family protein